MGIDGVLGSPLLFVLVVLPLRRCFECLHSPRVPTLGKSPFSLQEGFWCRRSTALSSSWVSNLGESTFKETNRSFDRSRSKFADPRYRPRGRITKPVTVTTAYNRTILSGTAASAQYKMAKAALHLKLLDDPRKKIARSTCGGCSRSPPPIVCRSPQPRSLQVSFQICIVWFLQKFINSRGRTPLIRVFGHFWHFCTMV